MAKRNWKLLNIVSLMVSAGLMVTCPAGRADPTEFGLPARLGSLTDLQKISWKNGLSSTQNTEVQIYWLADERRHPSNASRGYGGGFITSPYIEAQLIKSLRECSDIGLLDALASSPGTDHQIREAIRIALALLGDKRQRDEMIRILENHPWYNYRQLAAEALGDMGDTAILPILERASKNDSFQYVRYTMTRPTDGTSPARVVHPVRQSAEEAIRILKTPAALIKARMRVSKFGQVLAKTDRSSRLAMVPSWLMETMENPLPAPSPALELLPAGSTSDPDSVQAKQ